MTAQNESGQGVAFGLGATLLWGSYPLWYKPLAGLDAYHLLSWPRGSGRCALRSRPFARPMCSRCPRCWGFGG
jgi:hypothetical protein